MAPVCFFHFLSSTSVSPFISWGPIAHLFVRSRHIFNIISYSRVLGDYSGLAAPNPYRTDYAPDGLESLNRSEPDNLNRKSPKSTNKPSTTTGIMKHSHAGTISADLRRGNCHSTKTPNGWIWSKLDKDSRLCNRCYKYEKRSQEPRPLTLANPVDGRTCDNCGANNISKWQRIDRCSPWLCLHCWYKATHHTLLNYINSTESLGRPKIHLIQVRATNATSFQRSTYHHRYTDGLLGHLHLSRL